MRHSNAGQHMVSDDADFVAYHARASGSRVACIDLATGGRLSYAEFDRRVAKCAGYLNNTLKTTHGTRVAILARNGIDLLALHFACVRVGAILQPLNWRLSGAELKVLVRDAEPELFIYQTEFGEAARVAIEDSSIRQVVRIAPDGNAFADAVEASPAIEGVDYGPNAPITLLYTSGTTGRSKGVIMTRRNAWATAFNFSMVNEVAARDVLLCDMPMFHVAGLFGVARAALFMGATLLISDRFTPAVALARLSDKKLRVTHYFAVPQMAMAMMQEPAYPSSDLSGLKALVMGGAPLPKSVVDKLLADGIMPIEGYGLSEAGTVFGIPLDRDVIAKKSGSCGVRAPLIQARLVTKDGRDAGPDEVGEIWLRGPSVTPGYWNQPEITAKAFSEDGWYRSGDAARCDADGFYQIVDRWKDMYISGGENVYPAEVEAALVEHPAIAEASVVGVADPRWGETGCAYIIARAPITAAEVLEHCRARLAGYKVPKHVHFIDVLPRTASGKVRKDELRQSFQRSGKEKQN